jgi:2-polyprenyl-6-methoxyphenol hydroxylase-like FAD-dependent oxidoreductase
MTDTQVLIAGGGPAGLVLALELGARGVACMLLNDAPHTARHPKANAVSSRTMEHMRHHGLSARLRDRGLDPDHPTDLTYFTHLTGYEIGRFRQPSRNEALAEARAGTGAWASAEPPLRCSQIFLEEEMKSGVDALTSVDVRFGWKLTGFEDLGPNVTAVIENAETGENRTVSARYLVGCDGGNSLVRKSLGIELEGESGVVRPMMGGPMYAAYFRATEEPDWLPERRAWQYWTHTPDMRALMVHVDSDRLFLFHFALQDGVDGSDPTALIHRAVGREFPLEIISSVNWNAGYSLVAQKYRMGNVFLAGDAVHLFTPTGGMGMNTGVDDAANLGWKLAAVLRGDGGETLLESYEAERRPIGIRNVNFARGFADSVGNVEISENVSADTPEAAAERARLKAHFENHAEFEFVIPGAFLGLRYENSPVIAYDGTEPPPDHPNDYTPNAIPGSRAPHVWLGNSAFFDRLGTEFTLLRFGGVAGDLGPAIPLLDLDDTAARTLYGADYVLIRPDQHVAWRGNEIGDAAALVDTVWGRTAL